MHVALKKTYILLFKQVLRLFLCPSIHFLLFSAFDQDHRNAEMYPCCHLVRDGDTPGKVRRSQRIILNYLLRHG